MLTARGISEDADGALSVRARVMRGEPALYTPLSAAAATASAAEIDVRLLPFADWGNRGSVAMRVWLPAEVGQREEA